MIPLMQCIRDQYSDSDSEWVPYHGEEGRYIVKTVNADGGQGRFC
jgi:hypothetical protein